VLVRERHHHDDDATTATKRSPRMSGGNIMRRLLGTDGCFLDQAQQLFGPSDFEDRESDDRRVADDQLLQLPRTANALRGAFHDGDHVSAIRNQLDRDAVHFVLVSFDRLGTAVRHLGVGIRLGNIYEESEKSHRNAVDGGRKPSVARPHDAARVRGVGTIQPGGPAGDDAHHRSIVVPRRAFSHLDTASDRNRDRKHRGVPRPQLGRAVGVHRSRRQFADQHIGY
jgi:hypothetical protein